MSKAKSSYVVPKNSSAGSYRILIAYGAVSGFVKTTHDYLGALGRHSTLDVRYINVVNVDLLQFNLDDYDAVLVNYCARLIFDGYVNDDFVKRLSQWNGVKILSVQDEYDHTNKLKQKINDIGFDIVLTCVPPNLRERIYPAAEFPKTVFHQVLTGYVPEDTGNFVTFAQPLSDRHTQIGYRGRDIGPRYGQLGFEKYSIGKNIAAICHKRGIIHDIEVDEESRIYGDDWYRFIGSCRAMLGSESGSNVFDFEGALATKYQAIVAASGGKKPSYEDFLPLVKAAEVSPSMGQISPRIFECASLRTALILFVGEYSGVLVPDVHYLALEKDYSNIDAILVDLQDDQKISAMTQRVWQDLIASQKYSYRAFASFVEDLVTKAIVERPRQPCAQSTDLLLATGTTLIAQTGHIIETPTANPLSPEQLATRALAAQSAVYIKEGNRLCRELSDLIAATNTETSSLDREIVLGAVQDNGTLWPNNAVTLSPKSPLRPLLLALQDDCDAWFKTFDHSEIAGMGTLSVDNGSRIQRLVQVNYDQHSARYHALIKHIASIAGTRPNEASPALTVLLKQWVRGALLKVLGEGRTTSLVQFFKRLLK
jgi:hypothetical protein